MEGCASRQRGGEFKSPIGPPPGPRPQAFFPSQSYAVALEAGYGPRQRIESIGFLCDRE
jgi:hypothetical protein